MQRTISLVLPQHKELCETIYSFNSIVNDHICGSLCNKTTSKIQLHHLLYSRVRKSNPEFPSALIQNARDNAIEMLKGNKFNPFTKKRLDSSIRFDLRTAKVLLSSGELQLTTVSGRKKYKIKVPDYFSKYFSWKVKSVTLGIERKKTTLRKSLNYQKKKRKHLY